MRDAAPIPRPVRFALTSLCYPLESPERNRTGRADQLLTPPRDDGRAKRKGKEWNNAQRPCGPQARYSDDPLAAGQLAAGRVHQCEMQRPLDLNLEARKITSLPGRRLDHLVPQRFCGPTVTPTAWRRWGRPTSVRWLPATIWPSGPRTRIV